MSKILRYGVISDTHGTIAAPIYSLFQSVERIYHCGDIGAEACLMELETIAPVVAVAGNMDPWPLAGMHPDDTVHEELFGRVAIAHGMVFGHDNSLIARGLLEWFAPQSPRVILFGHSHVPYLRRHGKILVLNPGSATLPQGGRARSVGIIEYEPDSAKLTAHHIDFF